MADCPSCLQADFELHTEDCEYSPGRVVAEPVFTCGKCGSRELEWFNDVVWPSIVPAGVRFLCLRCYALVKVAAYMQGEVLDKEVSPKELEDRLTEVLSSIEMCWRWYASRALDDFRELRK